MRISRSFDKNLTLPLAVFGFFAFCFLLHPLSPLHTGLLADPDDYMRLNQVIGWLQGQGWYDLSQPRLSPGAHTVIHWARLVDMPIAGVMLPLIPTLGLHAAAMIASFIVPPVLFAVLLMLLCALAKPFTGSGREGLAAVFVLFAPMVLFNFTPGRVDHHGYQILIAGFGLLCLGRMQDGKGWYYAVMSAASFACGLWIGTEALPWIILFIACLAIRAGWQGGMVARNAAIFGAAFPVATLITVPMALPPEEWRSLALSWFSLADVIFAALAGVMLIGGAALGTQTKNKYLRLIIMLTLGIAAAAIFVYLVPDVLHGPFADYDTFDASTALDNITEAQPLATVFQINRTNPLTWSHALQGFIRFLFLPLLALAFIGYKLRKAQTLDRAGYAMHGIYLLASLLLTLFWQVRVGHFMQLFAIAPLTALAWASWQRIVHMAKNPERVWYNIAVFLLLGPLPIILLPAIADRTPFYPDVVLFPAARAEPSCPLQRAADFLNTQPSYATRTLTILSTMNEGPELLFRTHHNVVAANYNVAGNADMFAFFHARDDATARAIARKWHGDVVLVCRNITPFMAGLDHPKLGSSAFLRPDAKGNLHLVSSLRQPTLIERLVNGHPPSWLKPVEIPDDKGYLLFEIRDWGSGLGGQGSKK